MNDPDSISAPLIAAIGGLTSAVIFIYRQNAAMAERQIQDAKAQVQRAEELAKAQNEQAEKLGQYRGQQEGVTGLATRALAEIRLAALTYPQDLREVFPPEPEKEKEGADNE